MEHVSIEQPIAGPLDGKCDAAQDGQGAKTSPSTGTLTQEPEYASNNGSGIGEKPRSPPPLQPFWHATPPLDISLYPRGSDKRLGPDNHNR